MRRVALRIAYRGRFFSGSQFQPGLRTVVGDMMRDLSTVCSGRDPEWFDIKPSSRTDAGVDALGNVVAVNTEFRDNMLLLKALNAVSEYIYYTAIADVSEDFNPRYADVRRYRYILPSQGIDFGKAKECAQLFVGEHDFVRFSKPYEDKPTVTSIDRIDLEEKDGFIELTFSARFYLWNMIRKICAAIDAVGKGTRTTDDVRDALNGEEINFGVARPDALTLTDVIYKNITFAECDRSFYAERMREDTFSNLLDSMFLKTL